MTEITIHDCDIPSRRMVWALVRDSEDRGKVWSVSVWDGDAFTREGLPEVSLTLSLADVQRLAQATTPQPFATVAALEKMAGPSIACNKCLGLDGTHTVRGCDGVPWTEAPQAPALRPEGRERERKLEAFLVEVEAAMVQALERGCHRFSTSDMLAAVRTQKASAAPVGPEEKQP